MYSTKQTQDDEKSVSRAHRELSKLDQQLGVSVAQFTEVYTVVTTGSDLNLLAV